jgi:NADP-dependent 3-hydroxy acid dehydrogenase YdfG
MGLATAKHVANKGARLSLADVQEAPLKALAAEIQSQGGTGIATEVDIRNRQQVESWIQRRADELGRIDGAANRAGVIGKHINMKAIHEIDG